MKGRKPADVASRAAYEEVGLIGQVVGGRPLGNFHYEKRLARERAVICEVRAFFRVEQQLDDWPERGERERKWFDANEAVALVEEDGRSGRLQSGRWPSHSARRRCQLRLRAGSSATGATPQGGHVTVWDAGFVPTLRNGTGIPADIADKLFQPFFTTRPNGEGTGLGVSITCDFVTQQHGGSIAVDSKVGEYSEFTIRLPRKP